MPRPALALAKARQNKGRDLLGDHHRIVEVHRRVDVAPDLTNCQQLVIKLETKRRTVYHLERMNTRFPVVEYIPGRKSEYKTPMN